MNNTPPQEPPAQGMSSESGHTLPSRLLQPTSDPSVSKRVCFYKSGDYTFSGHRMIITTRTFKTFDALLDALSKKVPLPFGVRTITTPRGTHFVKGLEDLNDGGSYVCSDQKRVKPLNLDEVNRRQVPWNTTRLLSTGRQRHPGPQLGQFGRRNEATKRPAKVNERAVVRTPKRLTVFKNKDPTVKRTIVLQRRTAPTFEALLDYLSHILQFPVLKLYSTDGRRVDGLAALILCSGVIVAAGNEPFRLGNYSFHQAGQMFMETVESSMLQPPPYNNKSFSGGRGSKNFSQSSERYIVNQIKASRNGSTNNNLHHNNNSFEPEINQRQMSLETCETAQAGNDHCPCIVPQDNDIEKSFCVNQDGSMTVEMKVRLTIKEEEMLHWTTTLSRTSLSKRTVCPLVSELDNCSPDSNNAVAKNSSSISEDEAKEENHPTVTERGVGFNNQQLCQDYTSTPLEKTKPRFKRTPTPGPQRVKKSSVDSVKMVTESAVQESTMGHYSYMARTADGGTAEGYCVVRHSSSSSKRPIPRPRKTASAGTNNKGSTFSMKSTGVAEVLQIENKGLGVRETVMHIYESQGCHDSYFANEQYSADTVPLHNSSSGPGSKPSTDSGSHLSSNDCDIDSTWQPPIADSQQSQKEEIFSLSSEPMSPAHKITNDLSSVTVNETQAETNCHIQSQHKEKVKNNAASEKKKVIKPAKKQNSSSLTSSSEKNQKEAIASPLKNRKKSSSDKISSKASVGKKSFTSSESAKSGQKNKATEKPQMKKFSRDEKTPSKEKALLANIENVKRTPSKNTSKAALKENGHNVNIPETKTGRSQMKKNISDFLQPKRSLSARKKTVSKPKSMTENKSPSPKQSLELNESVSMPLLNPSPSEIHQYVENWLEKVSPDAVPYTEETDLYNSEPQKKVVFQIGGESDSEEKSEKQSNPEERCPSSDGALKKSGSYLSEPLCHEEQGQTVVHSQQMAKGSCVSMPTFRIEPDHQENPLRSHKSAAAIGPAGDKSLSSECNVFSPKAKMKPVLEQISSSMECIRKASDKNLEKSNSHPNFPTHVASVFGSSYKAFLSFVSVMTLRDSLTDTTEDGNSEAMLMMESLQKISVIENEEEQRASLTDLQNKASSQFRERWKDFQILRERVESEVMSPKFSETEFALDVTSEGGDVFDENPFGIDELMDELNIPQDLREEIASTIQQAKSFFPTEEKSLAKTAEQSPELNSTCEDENINEILSGSEQQTELVKQETVLDFEETKLRDESLTDKENETDGKEVENQVDDGDREDDEEIDDVQERGKAEQERCEESEEEVNRKENRDTEQDEAGSGNEEEEELIEKVEEGTEEEMTVDENEDNLKGEMEVNEEIDDRLTNEEDQEGSEDNSVEETDDREAVEGNATEESEEEKDEKTMERNNKSKNILGERDEEDEMEEDIKERDEEEEMEDSIKERDEEEEMEDSIKERDEEEEMEDSIKERDEEEEMEDSIKERDEEEEVEDSIKERDEEEEVEDSIEERDEEEEMEDSIKERDEEEEVEDSIEERDEEEENIDVMGEREEEEGIQDIIEEKDVDKETDNTTGERSEEEEAENVILDGDDEVRLENITGDGGEEEVEDINRDINEEEESKNITSSEEEQREDSIKEGDEETEPEDDIRSRDEEEETGNITEEREQEEETAEDVTEEKEEGEVEVISKESEEEGGVNEGDERELEDEVEDEDGGEVGVKGVEERMITDQEEEDDKKTEEEEESDEGGESRKEMETTAVSVEEESVVEEEQVDNRLKTGRTLDEEEEEEEEEAGSVELNERSDNEVDSLTGGQVCTNLLLEEASYLHQRRGSYDEDQTHSHSDKTDPNTESPTKYSSEGQSVKEEENGADSVNELETDEGGEGVEERSGSLPHPVEVSQELLDFVNSALKSSSLIFTYDSQGNVRIEPDRTRTVQTKKSAVRKRKKDSSYGFKCLPSPSTSDLSDYRPESSGSGGYKTQDSLDIVTESGEESSERPFPVCRHSVQKNNIPKRKTNVEEASSKQSNTSQSKSAKSFSTVGSGTKASREDLSYFSAASSLKPDSEPAMEAAQCMSFPSEKHSPDDGVLIDQGRWLLKENHLIRKSPPVSIGMYGQLENTSSDTASEDSPSHSKTQHSPLAAISSSELEEMAKPQTPKCTYFNMPHGSDSDPFMDDASLLSGKNCTSSFKGRGVKVSPTIDTSKTWANKNGSMSSFASVEFKVPDRKVHPEGESSAVTQARRTSSARGGALQAQDSLEALHLRCGQYCPIL